MYIIPAQYYFRIHHVRPRFKNDVESVLLYLALECSKLSVNTVSEYARLLNNAIRLYGDNMSKADKTINNWRTEISALFGFYVEDRQSNHTYTGEIAKFLATQQDLIQFFKYYLFYFQYPGGHLKHNIVKELIDNGIKFKPAQYILRVFLAGNKEDKLFSITKAEATHCIFNDLRVTRDNRDPKDVVQLILNNRRAGIEYDSRGDIIRYAGDILDYMVLANLLKENHGYYYINGLETDAITSFVSSNSYFTGYDKFYNQKNINLFDLLLIEPDWFEYVNSNLSEDLFSTNVAELLSETTGDEYASLIEKQISNLLAENANTKTIGDIGESLIIGHEKMRLKLCGLDNSINLVVKIPTAYGVGYDIQSFEGTPDMMKRYIEVKTTISRNRINIGRFHMTKNEWSSATTLKDRYFVYRLMISSAEKTIYILQDPVGLYRREMIDMAINDGADISFKDEICTKTDLMLWEK